jgi:hypothetical protein
MKIRSISRPENPSPLKSIGIVHSTFIFTIIASLHHLRYTQAFLYNQIPLIAVPPSSHCPRPIPSLSDPLRSKAYNG